MRDATAASYGAGWLRFCAFCARGRYRARPASPCTVGRYVAYLWLRGTVQPVSARTYLSPIRKRHLAAGFPNPCATDLVAEALDGFTNVWLDRHGAKPKRVALPASVAWRLAQVAFSSPDRLLRLRLAAVISTERSPFVWRGDRQGRTTLPPPAAIPRRPRLLFTSPPPLTRRARLARRRPAPPPNHLLPSPSPAPPRRRPGHHGGPSGGRTGGRGGRSASLRPYPQPKP